MPTIKSKGKNKQMVKAKKRPIRRPRVVDPQRDLLNGALRMILDPCGAELKPSAYSGQTGIVQRFSATYTYNSTNPFRVLTWVPGRFRFWENNQLTGSATTGVISYGAFVPGTAFLSANTQNARVLGACMDVSYLGKELDRSGYVAVGVVPAGTLPGAATTTIDSVTSRLAVKGRIPPGDFAIKWYPSNVDSEYVDVADGTPGGDDFDMANAITMTTSGLPTGAQLVITLTCIVEWNPRENVGTVVNTLTAPSVPDAVSRINTQLHNIGRWWTNLGEVSENAMHTASAVYSGATTAMHLAKGVTRMALTLA